MMAFSIVEIQYTQKGLVMFTGLKFQQEGHNNVIYIVCKSCVVWITVCIKV